MMISDEQVRRALEFLRSQTADVDARIADVPSSAHMNVDPIVIAHATALAASAPELRQDRIEHARHLLSEHPPTSEEVAVRMLSRIVADSLR
jgi:hypothetical protein